MPSSNFFVFLQKGQNDLLNTMISLDAISALANSVGSEDMVMKRADAERGTVRAKDTPADRLNATAELIKREVMATVVSFIILL